jgi:uncharacterized protein (DUF1697 family)
MKYVALFRGINVGGRHILPMAHLKGLLASLGCTRVRTYIQSGNVVFERKTRPNEVLVRDIQNCIDMNCHFKPGCIVLDEPAMHEAVSQNPFSTTEGKALHFFFLDALPENPDIATLASLKADSEQFALHQSVFYLYAPAGIGRSRLAAQIDRRLGVSSTARNWNTVKKLIEMLQ